MDFNSTVDIIIKDIDDLKKIISDFQNFKDVPKLQVEIAKTKCKNAIEILELLKTAVPLMPVTPAEKEEPPVADKPPVPPAVDSTPVPPVADIISVSDDQETSIEATIPITDNKKADVVTGTPASAIVHEEIIDLPREIAPEIETITKTLSEAFINNDLFDIDDNEEQERLLPEEKIEKIHKEMRKKSDSTIIAETFTPNPNSINDKIGRQTHPENPKGKKSKNLLEIIGINDKFLFIREIFNGNTDLYNTAINRLNNANNLTEAREIILDYVDNEEDDAHQMLIELVKRKF